MTDDGSSEASVLEVVPIPYGCLVPPNLARRDRQTGRLAVCRKQTIVHGTLMIPSGASRRHVPGCERTRQRFVIMAAMAKNTRALQLREARVLAIRIVMMNGLD